MRCVFCNIYTITQVFLHLSNFACSSVISRVSCRFTSSHWLTVLSRLLFCWFSARWARFSSATVPCRSFPSLTTNKQYDYLTGGKHVLWFKERNNLPGALVVFWGWWGLFALRTWDIQSWKKIKIFNVFFFWLSLNRTVTTYHLREL